MKMGISWRTGGAHKHFPASLYIYNSRLPVTHALKNAITTVFFFNYIVKLKSACKECRVSLMQSQYLELWALLSLCSDGGAVLASSQTDKDNHLASWPARTRTAVTRSSWAKTASPKKHCTAKMYRYSPMIHPRKQICEYIYIYKSFEY